MAKQEEFGSVYTQELSVGNGDATTGLWGTSGDYVTRMSGFRKNQKTTTNTSYGYWMVVSDTPTISPSLLTAKNLSNHYVAFSANIGRDDNDDTATTYARFYNNSTSEVSVTGTTVVNNHVVSTPVPASNFLSMDDDADRFPLVEFRTDKGTAIATTLTWYLLGEIQ